MCKRWMIAALLLAALTGCARQEAAAETTPETMPVTQPQTETESIPETEAPEELNEALEPGLILDPSQVHGSDFTDDPEYAARLDALFSGDLGLFEDKFRTRPVSVPLGSSELTPEREPVYWRYVYQGSPSLACGNTCWVYGCAFYGALYDGIHPQSGGSDNHEVVKYPEGPFSWESLQAWGIRQDAPSYFRVMEHSIVVLRYDSESITYVDTNGDEAGLTALRTERWQPETDGAEIYGAKVSRYVQPLEVYVPKGTFH